ncbi:MAG: DUF512 domain-containing protein [Coriobacteriales bacterium]|jgi:putative radical SAM enzyme (TIGR03279 family)
MSGDSKRADYAPTSADAFGGVARVASVTPESPAEAAGLRPGDIIVSADGSKMQDIIDWFWLSDGFEVELEIERGGQMLALEMHREPMMEWGFEFTGNLFDGVHTCINDCSFCFMNMLPSGMREGLYLRDDDYRLSFLQGNFVTLTNMGEEDVDRVVKMGLSPIHVSLHALDPDARLALMGRNHARGLEVVEELLEAGIDLHLQTVLVPGVNDGPVLDQLMKWAVDEPHVLSLGVVPLGFTRFQNRFDRSFDDPESAIAVIEQARPFQQLSLERNGVAKIHLADEFYVNAFGDDVIDSLPSAAMYDGYPQFFDGLGMLRSLVDDWRELGRDSELVDRISACKGNFLIVCGKALEAALEKLIAESELDGRLEVLGVENRFFGGNVDVTGLLTAQDVVESVRERMGASSSSESGFQPTVILPGAMFNDDGLTLDGLTSADIEREVSAVVRVVCYNAKDIFDVLAC